MPKALDLTGKTFGKLTALYRVPSKSGKTYWMCKCECGTEKEIQTGHLTSGATKSCGNCVVEKQQHPVVAFRKRIKLALVEAFYHKCAYCGIEDDAVIYDFHHLDPNTKSFGIANSATTRSRQAYLEEAKKCIMVCANCHRKIENGLIQLEDIKDLPVVNEEIYYNTLEELKK